MGKSKAPAAPDPQETAAAQTSQNIGTAIAQQQLNNVNQVTPYGSLTYDQTGSYQYTDPNSGDVHDIPTYTATQTLSEAQQAISDQNDQSSLNLATLGASQSGRLDDLLSRPLDLSGLPERNDFSSIQSPNLGEIGSGPELQSSIGSAGDITRSYGTDFSEDRQRVEDALLERLNPGLERDKSALEARLASQGIRVGSEAYSAALADFGQQTNDARLSAILGAGEEQSRLAGLEAQRASFENSAQSQEFAQQSSRSAFENAALQQSYQNQSAATQANNQTALQGFNADLSQAGAQNSARSDALNEAFAVRNQPINEITALSSGAQVQSPSFVSTNPAQLANTDVAGINFAAYNAEQQSYQAQLDQQNSLFGGLAGLGSSYITAASNKNSP